MGFSFIDLVKIFSCLLLLLKIIKAQEECRTPASENGVCVPYGECPFANELVQIYGSFNQIPPYSLDLIKRSKCSQDGQPIRLCCKIKNNNRKPQIPTPLVAAVNENSRSTPDLDFTQDYVSQLNTQGFNILNAINCGKPDNNRVAGGNETDLGEFPWMALLRSDSPEKEFVCGGSLITEDFILTAAHCVNNPTTPIIGIRLGEHDLSTDKDCKLKGTKTICNPPVQDVEVENIIIHPEYSYRYKTNDIALIKLKEKAKIQRHIKTVCLPITQTSFDQNVNDFFIAGWGNTEHNPTRNSNVLLKALVVRRDRSICQQKFSQVNINQKHLCAGDLETGRDTCHGDSGGPLVGLHAYKNLKRYIQYGIVASGGAACNLSQALPGIYTNIITFMPWITSNIV